MAPRDVALVLVEYGRELNVEGAAQVGHGFSGIAAADDLIVRDPNAFLFGVLFTQGIPAERAWAGPYLLSERLGNLDPRWLASHPHEVREAFQRPPMLHRFKETLPRWIVSAAERLDREWGGDAALIWPAGTPVAEVVSRLTAFDGIGRKKAVMAAEILVRHFRKDLIGRERSSVAFDVHIRRVFLRSGLADEDTPEAIEEAARAACPEAPGTLDLAAWLIGRQTCRPREPQCDECRLGEVCARRVWLTPQGVGARRPA